MVKRSAAAGSDDAPTAGASLSLRLGLRRGTGKESGDRDPQTSHQSLCSHAAFSGKNESRFRRERRDGMLTKNDFSASDWKILRDSPYLVGMATLMADSSGFGTIKESIALAQSIMENQASNIPFIRDLTSKTEMESAQSALKQRLEDPEARPTKEGVRRLTLDEVDAAVSILKGKACTEEIDAYRKLIYGVAEKVANAATEGGFLGIGGTRVSSGEQSFLEELRNTLQLERVKKA
jgi:hypothetical protein